MTQKSVEQLLRVNHAGERGAISIYKGQILISQLLHPEVVPSLGQMLSHEQKHFHTFDEILRARGLRHCHALALWALGGWILGILTAILGQRAIWTCTAAIESTVNAHLVQQVEFLRTNDREVLVAVESIQSDEASHEEYARTQGGDNPARLYLLLWRGITSATECAIWLSTRM